MHIIYSSFHFDKEVILQVSYFFHQIFLGVRNEIFPNKVIFFRCRSNLWQFLISETSFLHPFSGRDNPHWRSMVLCLPLCNDQNRELHLVLHRNSHLNWAAGHSTPGMLGEVTGRVASGLQRCY